MHVLCNCLHFKLASLAFSIVVEGADLPKFLDSQSASCYSCRLLSFDLFAGCELALENFVPNTACL